MEQLFEKIGNKQIQISQPYTPKKDLIGNLVGREEIMQIITASWMGGKNILPLSPLLVGEPGIGKNRLVYELAELTGKDLYIFQGHEDVTAEEVLEKVKKHNS